MEMGRIVFARVDKDSAVEKTENDGHGKKDSAIIALSQGPIEGETNRSHASCFQERTVR
jgi:hypothetical protein